MDTKDMLFIISLLPTVVRHEMADLSKELGSYNPNTDPSSVDLKFDRALYWLQVGAQPTDTVRNILSREGVLLKKHLLEGVKKGAFDEAEAERRFEAWKSSKEAKLNKTKEQLTAEREAAEKARLSAEIEANKARAAELAKKKAAEEAKNKADETPSEGTDDQTPPTE